MKSAHAEIGPPVNGEAWARTLPQLLERAARLWPAGDALVVDAQRLNFGQLRDRARRRARSLLALGVAPGDHVGILLPTSIEFAEMFFAIALAGAVAVPINARYRAIELAYLIENADLVGLVTTDRIAEHVDFVERLHQALPSLAEAPDFGALALPEAPKLRWAAILGAGEPAGLMPERVFAAVGAAIDPAAVDARAAAVAERDLAIVLYTSGTTSYPKGCLIAQAAIVGNGAALAERYEFTGADRVWSPLPMFHIAAVLPMVAIYTAGGPYIAMRHFEAGTALRMIESERATVSYHAFVTFTLDLINHPDFPTTDLSSLRVMNSNLGVAPPAVGEALLKAIPQAIQVGTYGLTEASGTITTSALGDPLAARIGRLGKPLPGWEVRIVDLETGRDKVRGPDGDTGQGEIWARGPGRLSGYYKDPAKTAESIDAEGWLHTGDLGSCDRDGNMMFHGRIKDMLKVGGENVAAAEIEAVICRHPAVKLAQVVGVPDPRLSEVAAVFVELQDGATLDEAGVKAAFEGQIASFKVPRHVRFVTEWPMSASKIQKYKLRDRLVAELAAARPADAAA